MFLFFKPKLNVTVINNEIFVLALFGILIFEFYILTCYKLEKCIIIYKVSQHYVIPVWYIIYTCMFLKGAHVTPTIYQVVVLRQPPLYIPFVSMLDHINHIVLWHASHLKQYYHGDTMHRQDSL